MSDDYRQPPGMGSSRPATLVCRNGVPPEILSGWRDGLLPPDQAAWLERHAPTCPACSARLRDYDDTNSALSGQIIPRPGADLWPGVRAAIEREARGTADSTRRGLRMPRGMALGGIGAGVAALLIVALFAGLLISRQAARPTTTATPITTQTVAATATTAATATPSGPGYWTTLTGCPGVPAGVRTVYNAGIQEQKSGPTIVTLQRSDDCGATWTDLTPPQISGVSYTTNVNLMTIFASPLNPDTAYLTLQVSGTACSSINSATISTSSSTVCQPQYVTTNGGASWQRLALPVRGILGNISPVDPVFGYGLRGQGSRLYGVVTDTILASSGVIPPGRLVASDDGGVTWHVADAALSAQGLEVWDFAPVPTGSAVYVAAEPVNDPARQPPQYGVTLTTWSSLDAGATWKQESNPPGVTTQSPITDMGAGVTASGQRALYVIVGGKSGITILGSLDDGATWRSDSHLATSSGGNLSSPEIVGSLPNGSAVVVSTGNAPTLAWLPGSAPRTIAQGSGFDFFTNPILQQRGDNLYLWLMGTPPNSGSTALTTEYTQLKL